MGNIVLKALVVVMFFVTGCGGDSRADEVLALPSQDVNTDPVSKILTNLQYAAGGLKSYQCKIEYLFSQPILESKTLRMGNLYYARFDGGSKLRIEFDALTQDDGPMQKNRDIYIFDGHWLTHIDYQIKQAQKRQLAEANEPIDAFELVKRTFPIIGFDRSEDLKKQFDVNLIGESNGLVHLFLKVKPDSQYKDDYTSVDVWIDTAKTGLPEKVATTNNNGDIYEIRFIEPKVNEMINEKVFEFTIPNGFGKPEVIPLKK
ncbi:MAG: outer-membrane lipoprotein carrier protein LolA [Sedimentisphaerales bacterium]|nr:outer-membrane lipoprotein carrier protein LolA [Sedimentisphaerales bacterium]